MIINSGTLCPSNPPKFSPHKVWKSLLFALVQADDKYVNFNDFDQFWYEYDLIKYARMALTQLSAKGHAYIVLYKASLLDVQPVWRVTILVIKRKLNS